VGVKRQDWGELGKRANGQAGVFVDSVSPQGYTVLDRRV
jgi:SRSO17 transposase